MFMSALYWPLPAKLRRRFKALALADAILSPDWQYRYFSYNSAWNVGEEMASMRDGEGSEYFFWFPQKGACFKIFAKESPLSVAEREQLPAQAQATAPEQYAAFFAEPAFTIHNSTALGWFDEVAQKWQGYGDLATACALLQLVLDGTPQAYQAWAEEYYERPIDLLALQSIFAFEPLDGLTVQALNPELSLPDLSADLTEISFPAVK